MRALVATDHAVVYPAFTLLKKGVSLRLPAEASGYNESLFVRASYKRFVKLRKFVFPDRMGLQDTYLDYIRYKYRFEDYPMKRQLVLGDTAKQDWRQQVFNTLDFILQSVMFSGKQDEKATIKLANQIMKNVLNVHFNILMLNAKPRSKKQKSNAQVRYREEFVHLQALNEQTAQDKVFAQFDQCVVLFNEEHGTRL